MGTLSVIHIVIQAAGGFWFVNHRSLSLSFDALFSLRMNAWTNDRPSVNGQIVNGSFLVYREKILKVQAEKGYGKLRPKGILKVQADKGYGKVERFKIRIDTTKRRKCLN